MKMFKKLLFVLATAILIMSSAVFVSAGNHCRSYTPKTVTRNCRTTNICDRTGIYGSCQGSGLVCQSTNCEYSPLYTTTCNTYR